MPTTHGGSFTIVELSHPIEAGMKTYPGLPEPRTEVLVDYEGSRERYQGQAEFYICNFWLCGNTGTYVDAPIHRHRGAADLAAIPAERLVHVPLALIDVPDRAAIDASVLRGRAVRDRAVLFRTGWSRHWRTEQYFAPNPHLTREACEHLAAEGAALVGIDSVNIDALSDPSRPAHTVLLGAGIPVCEHLTGLSALTGTGEFFHAAPLRWVGGATFPVRAYALRAAAPPPAR